MIVSVAISAYLCISASSGGPAESRIAEYQITSSNVQVEIIKAIRVENREAVEHVMYPCVAVLFISLVLFLTHAPGCPAREFKYIVHTDKYRMQRSNQKVEYEDEHLF